MSHRLRLTVCCGLLTGLACGCQSQRSFSMDSNSRAPWFGLNLSLPKASAKRKTLETISDTAPLQARIETAGLKTTASEPAPVRKLLPKWLGGTESSLPLPPDAPRIGDEGTVTLEGPREEFR
jgi:hypothetical protein